MVTIRRVAGWIGIAVALAGCAPTAEKPEEGPPLVWPAEAAKPRIMFVRLFSRPEHLGLGKGFFERLADVLFGASESRLVRPMAVVTVGQVLYVADPGSKGVHRFDQAAGRHDLIRLEHERLLPSPVALARGGEGKVYVTDSALGRVFVILPGASHATPVPLQTKLGRPTGIAADPKSGRLFVVDTAAHRVNVFNREGMPETSFGGRGAEDGKFNYPTFVWRDGQGRLYVNDSLNFRIQVFDERGRFLGKFGRLGDGTGDIARHKGIATDHYGHVYVVDALFHAVQIFDASGRFLLSIGAIGQARGEFWLPTGIFISEDGTIYIADSYNQRVQVFRYIGGPT